MEGVNNDIAKYLKGELSPAEMHALEQKALHDPFLAEALEGAEHAGAENFSVDIEVLQQSVRAKTKRRSPKTITLNGWGLYAGIAAGLTLLVISTYVIFLSIDHRRDSMLSMNEKQADSKTASDSSEQPAVADTVAVPVPDPEAESKPELQQSEKSQASTRKRAQRSDEPASGPAVEGTDIPPASFNLSDVAEEETGQSTALAPAQQPVAMPDSLLLASEMAGGEDTGETKRDKHAFHATDHETEKDIRAANKQTRIAKRKVEPSTGVTRNRAGDISKSLEARFITGKVVASDNGTGIPGVNVVIKGTNHGTVTDESGNYQIEIQPEQSLTFDFIGYTPEEVAVEDDSKEVNVRLNEDVQALSEVVVTGSGTITAEKADVFEMAEPAGGRKAFKKYLEENLVYPAEAIDNKIEGKVTVQFSVEPDGTVTDFRILKGLGFGCDEELIRLIKEGPKWKPSKKNEQPVKEDVRVRLKFDLPE